eukprot:scaffold310_cov335-Pavlova_lutheri.AAC.24
MAMWTRFEGGGSHPSAPTPSIPSPEIAMGMPKISMGGFEVSMGWGVPKTPGGNEHVSEPWLQWTTPRRIEPWMDVPTPSNTDKKTVAESRESKRERWGSRNRRFVAASAKGTEVGAHPTETNAITQLKREPKHWLR